MSIPSTWRWIPLYGFDYSAKRVKKAYKMARNNPSEFKIAPHNNHGDCFWYDSMRYDIHEVEQMIDNIQLQNI